MWEKKFAHFKNLRFTIFCRNTENIQHLLKERTFYFTTTHSVQKRVKDYKVIKFDVYLRLLSRAREAPDQLVMQ